MQIVAPVTYFANEGRSNLPECLRLTFEAARLHGLNKVVIFTAIGEGVTLAIDTFLNQEQYAHLGLVAVTFPQGTPVSGETQGELHLFPGNVRNILSSKNIPLVRANLPFSSISAQYAHHGSLAQELSIVGNVLNVFGGGMSLCLQAVLIACDAGEVKVGEHVVVMTADTSLIVRAAPTRGFLTDLIVRQIVCKPAFLTISKDEALPEASVADEENVADATDTRFLEGGSNETKILES